MIDKRNLNMIPKRVKLEGYVGDQNCETELGDYIFGVTKEILLFLINL